LLNVNSKNARRGILPVKISKMPTKTIDRYEGFISDTK